jgi:hypothetical protein
LFEHRWQVQRPDLGDLALDVADDQRDLAALVVDIDAEAPHPLAGKSQVEFQFALELGTLLGGHEAVGQFRRDTGLQRLLAHGPGLALDAHGRWCPGGEIEVRGALVDHALQVGIDARHGDYRRNNF